MKRLTWLVAALALLSGMALAGCGKPKEDEATRKYVGPGPSKKGAPSMVPGGSPIGK